MKGGGDLRSRKDGPRDQNATQQQMPLLSAADVSRALSEFHFPPEDNSSHYIRMQGRLAAFKIADNISERLSFEFRFTQALVNYIETINKRGNESLTVTDCNAIISILHAREEAIRLHSWNYSLSTLDPFNQHYIALALSITKTLQILAPHRGLRLVHALAPVTNSECPNLKRSGLDKKSIEFYLNSINDRNVRVKIGESVALPELYGCYFSGEESYTFYTIMGLLLVNGITAHIEMVEGRHCFTITINHDKFRLLTTFTPNKNSYKRCLHIEELYILLKQRNSISLRVEGNYHSPGNLIEMFVASYWEEQPFDENLVLDLITDYFNTDSLIYPEQAQDAWRNTLKRWCKDLLLVINEKGVSTGYKAPKDLYGLYFKKIEGERYFLEYIAAMLKNDSESNADFNVLEIMSWFLSSSAKEGRLTKLVQIYTNFLNYSIDNPLVNNYFTAKGETRYQKLLKGLSARGIISSNYFKYMFPGFKQTEDFRGNPIILRELYSGVIILAENGEYFCELDVSQEYYERGKAFLNYHYTNSRKKPREYTLIERNRIARTKYASSIASFEDEETARNRCLVENKPLPFRVVWALRNLLNATYLDAQESDKDTEQADADVVTKFYQFIFNQYHNLSSEHRECLDEYQYYDRHLGKRIKFKELIQRLENWDLFIGQENSTWCLNEILAPLFQVVLDYSDYRFREYIRNSSKENNWLGKIREKSQNLVFFSSQTEDASCIGKEDRTKRLKMLLVHSQLKTEKYPEDSFYFNLSADLSVILNKPIEKNVAISEYDTVIEIFMDELSLINKQNNKNYSIFASEPESDKLLKSKRGFIESVLSGNFFTNEKNWYELSDLTPYAGKTSWPLLEESEIKRVQKCIEQLKELLNTKHSYLFQQLTPENQAQLELQYQGVIGQNRSSQTVTHWLEVDGNLLWQKCLLTLSSDKRNLIERRVTPSSSFDKTEYKSHKP